jgi:hypothetical protein
MAHADPVLAALKPLPKACGITCAPLGAACGLSGFRPRMFSGTAKPRHS